MVWFLVDDGMAFHQKTIQAGNAAIGLWARAGSYCALTLSDGFVPRSVARSMGTVAQCKALVVAGLWLEVDGGYKFHEWDERQPTKEDVQAKRKAERVRKAEQRKRRNVPVGQPPDDHADIPPDTYRDSIPESAMESQGDSAWESAHPFHSVPFHSSSSGDVVGGSLVATVRENDPPKPHCDKHPGGTSDPCGACAGARKRWVASNLEREESAAIEAAARAEEKRRRTRQAAADRAAAIDNCGLCDSRGYAGRALCMHDPDEADRAKRGMAAVREAMAQAKAAVS